jgi:hypothetical protein
MASHTYNTVGVNGNLIIGSRYDDSNNTTIVLRVKDEVTTLDPDNKVNQKNLWGYCFAGAGNDRCWMPSGVAPSSIPE